MPNFEHLFVSKEISVMELLASTHGTQGAAQTVRCPCKPIISSIGHLESPTEVQLNNW